MSIVIKIAGSTDKGKLNNDFLRVPYELNRNKKNWVPPLWIQEKSKFDFKKNPVWRYLKAKFWTAYAGDQPVGRIAAIVYKGNEKAEGYFGYLCADPNSNVLRLLIHESDKWLTSQGAKKVYGPFCPTINYELGVLVDGFDSSPFFMMPFNSPKLDNAILNLGYQKEHDFLAYNLNISDYRLPKLSEKLINRFENKYDIGFQNINFSNIAEESKVVCRIYNNAFETHWGSQYFHLDEVVFMAHELKSIVNPELFFYLTLNGEKIGFILALPNINEVLEQIPDGKLLPFGWFRLWRGLTKIKMVRVLNVAISQKHRYPGAGLLLYNELFTRLKNKGFIGGELSWVSKSNVQMNGALKKLGAEPKKRYRVYSRNL